MSAEKTCNCLWGGDTQVQQCTLHQAHVDAIHEWADRARGAEAERDALAAKLKEQDAWIDDLLAICHRLALELECLLLDTKDLATVSRWWDSAMAALDGWHKAKDAASVRPVPAEPVNARLVDALKRLSFCAQTTGGVAGRDDELCSAIEASAKAIAEAEAQQERLLQDMHDAGREIDRVMAEAAPKAARLTRTDIAKALASAGLKPEDYREDGEILPLVLAIETAVLNKNGLGGV